MSQKIQVNLNTPGIFKKQNLRKKKVGATFSNKQNDIQNTLTYNKHNHRTWAYALTDQY